MRRMARFTIQEIDRDSVLIKDIGPWDEHPSVTNDAERVVKYLWDVNILGGKRLFYIDSENQQDEIIHEKGKLKRIQVYEQI